jgi:hypothetical protein
VSGYWKTESRPIQSVQTIGCKNETSGSGEHVTAVLFDSTGFLLSQSLDADTHPIKHAAEQFLAKLTPETPVAVYSYGVGERLKLSVLRDVIADGDRLRVDGKTPSQIEDALGVYDIKPIGRSHATVQVQVGDTMIASLSVLESIANHLAAFKGRKSLIWVCPSWIPAIDQGDSRLSASWLASMSAVQRAEIGIYPISCE